MIRSRFLAGMALCALLCALTPSVFAQGRGVFGPPGAAPATVRENRDLMRQRSDPGVAEPLDIRIQGEGISLPPGVSEDDRVSKPPEDRAPQSGAPQEGKSKPDAKRP